MGKKAMSQFVTARSTYPVQGKRLSTLSLQILGPNFTSVFLFSHKVDRLKWIVDLNAQTKTIKLKTGVKFRDIELGKAFLDRSPKVPGTREKHILDFIKMRNFMLQRTLSREWWHTTGGNIFKAFVLWDWYSEYIKNPYNSTMKRKMTRF